MFIYYMVPQRKEYFLHIDFALGRAIVLAIKSGNGNGNGLLFHMTQPISRSTIKGIACSKPTISEH